MVLFTVIAVTVMGVTLMAQEASIETKAPKNQDNKSYTPGVFVDKDLDGTCDNYVKYQKSEQGANYVDKDNDGVCDNHLVNGEKGNGYGKHYYHRHGHKHGHGYCHYHGYHKW